MNIIAPCDFSNWFNGSTDTLFDLAWKEKKNTEYKYNRNYDYWTDIQRFEEEEYKKGVYSHNGRTDNDTRASFEAMLKQIYFGINEDCYGCNFKPIPSPEEVHYKRHYMNWLSFKYKLFKKEFSSRKDDGYYYWITLNFKPNTPIKKCVSHTERFVSLSCLKGCKMTYCYEYYTKSENHPHAHILIEVVDRTGGLNTAELRQKFFSNAEAKTYMTEEAFDYKSSNAVKFNKRTRPKAELNMYLMGAKIPEKAGRCELDKQWRLENNIENVYVYKNG